MIRRPPDSQAKRLTTRPSLLWPTVGYFPAYIPSLSIERTCGFLLLFLIDFCFKQNTMGEQNRVPTYHDRKLPNYKSFLMWTLHVTFLNC